jgi:hypothetical protein
MHKPLLPFLGILALVLGVIALALLIGRLQRWHRQRIIARYDFGSAAALALRQKHPGLSSEERDLAWTALRQYFQICQRAGRRRMPMPSRLADDAWHCLILDTRRYAAFCQTAFGRFLHHVPQQGEERLTPPRRRVEGNPAWRLGRGFLPLFGATQLPLLFALDEKIGLAEGFSYHTPDPALRRQAAAGGDGGDCSACGSCGSDSSGDSGSDSGGDSGCSGGCSGGCGGGGGD